MADIGSRTTAIAQAIARQLDIRRLIIDQAQDLGQLTLTVKLIAGTPLIKSVEVADLRVVRRVGDSRDRE